MTRRTDNFYVAPLFYDLLSGEFQPPSDPEKRMHRLGRLAHRTFEAGEEVGEQKVFDETYRSFRYSPTWAEGAESTVTCRYMFEPSLFIMTGLAICAAANAKALAVTSFNANRLSFVQIDNGDGVKLELSPQLNRLRDIITERTQALFDTVEK